MSQQSETPTGVIQNYERNARQSWRFYILALLGAAFAGLFATTGFEYVPVPAGEVVNPRRTLPLAMVTSVLGATVLYAIIQAVAGAAHPDLGHTSAALVDAAGFFGGPRGRALMGLAGLVSAFGFCTGSALVGPRYLETFAHDRFLPAPLGHRPERLKTPVLAVVTLSAMVIGLLLVTGLGEGQRFDSLADSSNVAVVAQYIATSVAVLVLRRRPAPAGSFVIPFGPLVPLLALCGSGLFLRFVGSRELLSAGRLIIVGLVLGMGWRLLSQRRAEPAFVIFAVFLADRQPRIFGIIVRLQADGEEAIFAGVLDEGKSDVAGELIVSLGGFQADEHRPVHVDLIARFGKPEFVLQTVQPVVVEPQFAPFDLIVRIDFGRHVVLKIKRGFEIGRISEGVSARFADVNPLKHAGGRNLQIVGDVDFDQ